MISFLKRKRRAPEPETTVHSCAHDCPSCDYYDLVFAYSASPNLRTISASLKAAHTHACAVGHPDANSCREAAERTPVGEDGHHG